VTIFGPFKCRGHDAFLEALGDPALCFWILDKVPATMEEVVWIVFNLESMDRSRDTGTKLSTEGVEQSDWVDKKKEKYARVAVQPGTILADSSMCLPASGTVR